MTLFLKREKLLIPLETERYCAQLAVNVFGICIRQLSIVIRAQK